MLKINKKFRALALSASLLAGGTALSTLGGCASYEMNKLRADTNGNIPPQSNDIRVVPHSGKGPYYGPTTAEIIANTPPRTMVIIPHDPNSSYDNGGYYGDYDRIAFDVYHDRYTPYNEDQLNNCLLKSRDHQKGTLNYECFNNVLYTQAPVPPRQGVSECWIAALGRETTELTCFETSSTAPERYRFAYRGHNLRYRR